MRTIEISATPLYLILFVCFSVSFSSLYGPRCLRLNWWINKCIVCEFVACVVCWKKLSGSRLEQSVSATGNRFPPSATQSIWCASSAPPTCGHVTAWAELRICRFLAAEMTRRSRVAAGTTLAARNVSVTAHVYSPRRGFTYQQTAATATISAYSINACQVTWIII